MRNMGDSVLMSIFHVSYGLSTVKLQTQDGVWDLRPSQGLGDTRQLYRALSDADLAFQKLGRGCGTYVVIMASSSHVHFHYFTDFEGKPCTPIYTN